VPDVLLSAALLVVAHATSFLATAALLVFCCAWAVTSSRRPLGDDTMALILAASGFLGAFAAHRLWSG